MFNIKSLQTGPTINQWDPESLAPLLHKRSVHLFVSVLLGACVQNGRHKEFPVPSEYV